MVLISISGFIVNKIDTKNQEHKINEFYELGLGNPIPTSASHGRNIGDLLDKIDVTFPKKINKKDDDSVINLAISGMPNVGKSSLVNCLLSIGSYPCIPVATSPSAIP